VNSTFIFHMWWEWKIKRKIKEFILRLCQFSNLFLYGILLIAVYNQA
jgi:hypothetical protein